MGEATTTNLWTCPPELDQYIKEKTETTGGGRPHFLKQLQQTHPDIKDAILNIAEDAWIKNRPLGNIGHNYKTKYHTIFRLLKELEPWKPQITQYLLNTPRRKRFYIPDLDQSDYENVQAYIKHAHSEELKKYKRTIHEGERIWAALGYKDPAKWTQDEIDEFLRTCKDKDDNDQAGAQYSFVVAVRALCPHLDETMKVRKYFEKLGRHKWDIFAEEINLIHAALKPYPYEQLILDLHITIGAREGKDGEKAGICGITWERFKRDFTFVDDYESKVRKGIWWRDCPVDIFFNDLPARLRTLWIERGKPSSQVVLKGGYHALCTIYKTIRRVLYEYYNGKIDPSLLKELTTVHPHTADKIHVNLLWEAEVPLEVVAGEYLGQGEGIGLVGRGWLTIDVIKKYYLSLTRRSKRFQKIREKIRVYSAFFSVNGPVSTEIKPVLLAAPEPEEIEESHTDFLTAQRQSFGGA